MSDYDPDTGEVLEGTPASQQIVEQREHAADGKPVPARSRAASNVLKMIDDGEFDAELSHEMRDLLKQLETHAHNNKGQAKGEIDIKLKFSLANGMLVIVPDMKIKRPVEKRGGTALFIGEDGSLGRNPVGQQQFFGSRARDPDAPMREVKDI